jgi:glycine dehydrogenase
MNMFNSTYQEAFKDRHIGPDATEAQSMLQTLGVSSIDQLIEQTVPNKIRLSKPLQLPKALSEQEYLKHIKTIAQKNKTHKSYIGYGYYPNFTPTVILRNILENPGWYTQYTPYQAEIAQGRLEALLNFQTMVSDLTGMEVANASLLDEATAAAEAMAMQFSLSTDQSRTKYFVSEEVFPQTIEVVQTRAIPLGIEVVIGKHETFALNDQFFGALVQYPNKKGEVIDYTDFSNKCHALNIKITFASDLLSLCVIESPAVYQADIVIGSAQRFGVPMGNGGPHAAFFATKEAYKRQLPGRIIGVTIDSYGNPALRMALQTREQHIRREKATSNICTAQALLAIMASMYAVYHGPKGLRAIAERTHALACNLSKGLNKLGFTTENKHWFDTLSVAVDANTQKAILDAGYAKGLNFNGYETGRIIIALDETTSTEDVTAILNVFASAKNTSNSYTIEEKIAPAIPANILRKTSYLEHPVFNTHHSEHELLRYMKHLENKDLSLTHSMISLGSCTMKLNATTEMIPVTWAEMGSIHPFAPKNQTEGYNQMFDELSAWLCEITGFAAMSLQPNSGAQGEYAGLMTIKAYHEANGNPHRNVVLIPSSAHGTNPASAAMAGFKIIVTACDEKGNIDVADLKSKAEQYKDTLGALMVTYPSTHGVFEETIIEVCSIIHQNGGQVYMDGANMNAQVGLTSPATIGADVCHLNLHKTFCIPHGGGGPGMGPIGVAKHLVPYLPGHSVVNMAGTSAVSAAPYGSASILVISHAYIAMMGPDGLTAATKNAILNANYMKARLEEHFPILYSGKQGRVAHEMILDCRGFKNGGIEVVDIAKRLMDYGFHAPTVSFPVAGTLMVEPTESETKAELDRFCDAMISIRKEVEGVMNGRLDAKDNVLKNAPHTAQHITANEWNHTYSRTDAAYPLNYLIQSKFWPSVGRVNDTHGDRQLICTCPPIEAYMEESVA